MRNAFRSIAANGKVTKQLQSMCLMGQETVKRADYWISPKYKEPLSRKQENQRSVPNKSVASCIHATGLTGRSGQR